VGDQSFCNKYVEEITDEIGEVLCKVALLNDTQSQYLMLKASLSFSRMVHIISTVPPNLIRKALKRYDKLTLFFIENEILHQSLDAAAPAQAALGTSSTGLGLRSTEAHSTSAYISSRIACNHLVSAFLKGYNTVLDPNFTQAVGKYNSKVTEGHQISCEHLDPKTKQHTLSEYIDQRQLDLLIATSQPLHKARLISLNLPLTGAWLNAPPNADLGFKLSSRQFSVGLCRRLGLPIYSQIGPCPCCGKEENDAYGHHAVLCQKGPDHIWRHNVIRDTLCSIRQNAALSPRLEEPHLVGQNKTRPGDVVIPNWSMGRTAAIDVTVIHPVQLNSIQMTLQSGTEPIDQAEEAKITKYGQTCAANELDFIPFGMSTYGGYGHSALNTLKAVTRRVTARSTLPLSVIATNMHHQFAVGLAKSIASSIIARDPCPTPPLIPPFPKNNTATPTPAPPS